MHESKPNPRVEYRDHEPFNPTMTTTRRYHTPSMGRLFIERSEALKVPGYLDGDPDQVHSVDAMEALRGLGIGRTRVERRRIVAGMIKRGVAKR